MEKVLTIVVAAYNKQDLLPRCLDSLMIESDLMKLVQVLVVNDGSKDDTLGVARKYEGMYPEYFQVVDKENGNYGSVMNVALPLAQGKYFRTLDADDWYDVESYAKFVSMLSDTEADMIVTERFSYDEKRGIQERNSLGNVITGRDISVAEGLVDIGALKDCLNVPHFTFRTSLLRDSGLKWLEGIFYTDTMFDMWPLPLLKTVRFERLPVYVYLYGIEEQSMNPVLVRRNVGHFIMIAKEVIPYFVKNYDRNVATNGIQKYFLFQLLNFIYPDLLNDSRNLENIRNLHSMLAEIPNIQQELEDRYVHRGHKYIYEACKAGGLSTSFLILRYIRRMKYKCLK